MALESQGASMLGVQPISCLLDSLLSGEAGFAWCIARASEVETRVSLLFQAVGWKKATSDSSARKVSIAFRLINCTNFM